MPDTTPEHRGVVAVEPGNGSAGQGGNEQDGQRARNRQRLLLVLWNEQGHEGDKNDRDGKADKDGQRHPLQA
ncbi:hypothetical protein D3C72_2053240 [compost metagenome]